MSVIQHTITSFNGGELSPRMMGRVDTAVYQIGLETCENFVPTVEGPIVKRPGFEFIANADPTTSWLGTFKFNLTQHYVVEWGEAKWRFFTNGALIESGPGVPYTVATPYTAAQASAVCTDQSFDRQYLWHGSHAPAALKRTSAVTFAHEVLDLRNGPFADQNSDQAITVTASGTTGSVTLTASSAIFLAGHVGSLFSLEAKDFSTVKAWEAGMKAVAAGEQVRSDGKIYEALSSGVTGQVQPTHEDGDAWDGQGKQDELNTKGPYGVLWRYVSDSYGVLRITAIGGGGTTASATVLRTLPGSLVSVASHRWAHSLISAAAGWPSLGKIWKGRHMAVKDFWVIGSVVGDYGGGQVNFQAVTSSGLRPADLALRRPLATPDLPHWIAGDSKLLIGTPSLELAVGPINAQEALSADNIEAEPQSFYGSQPVAPAQIGTTSIFVQRGGRKIRESGYDFARDRYLASNIAIWARHILRPGAIQFAWQQEPEDLLFIVRADGQLAVHPHSPEQEIKGFARIKPGGDGRILSAVCIASEDGQADELWALIERGGVKRICRMAAWREDGDDVREAFFVDEGKRYEASPGQTHFTGATHLAGEAVAVLANGCVVEDVTVDGAGAFDIPASAAPAHAFTLMVGLSYTATCVTLRPELRPSGQSMQGVRQRVVKIALRLLETLGIRIGVASTGKLDNLLDRPLATPMGEPPELFTGDTPRAVSGGWDRDGRSIIVSDVPLPATIIAAMPRIEVEAKDP